MFCPECGKEIENNAKFCQFCGAQVNQTVNEVKSSQCNTKTEYYKQNLEKLKKKFQLINSFMCDISNLTLNISDDNLVHIMGDVTPKFGGKFKVPMEAVLTIPKGLFNSEKKICSLDTGCTFEFIIPYEELVNALSVIIMAKPESNRKTDSQEFCEEDANYNYWQKRTNELKKLLKIDTKNKEIISIILAIILYGITIPLLFIWYICPFFTNKKVILTIVWMVGLLIFISCISDISDKNLVKEAKPVYKAPIVEGAYDILPTEFGKGYDKTIKKHGVANIKKSNELLPKAAEIVSRNSTCDKISWVMLSDNKSTKDNLVIIVDCSNGKRFFLSEKEIAQNINALSEYQKAEGLISTHIAMCEARIKDNLNYPSTYKKLISKTGWKTNNYGNDIVIGFKAKNAFNLETEYTARCMINSSNQFSLFDIKEKK